MDFPEFKRSLAKAKPPGLAPALAALWWAGKDQWDKAHAIVMSMSATRLNSSPLRWIEVPTPEDPNVTLLVLAWTRADSDAWRRRPAGWFR